MSAELRATNYSEDWPNGLALELPVTEHLRGLYDLLRNGRNVSVTLVKNDGSSVIYELVAAASPTPEDGR